MGKVLPFARPFTEPITPAQILLDALSKYMANKNNRHNAFAFLLALRDYPFMLQPKTQIALAEADLSPTAPLIVELGHVFLRLLLNAADWSDV